MFYGHFTLGNILIFDRELVWSFISNTWKCVAWMVVSYFFFWDILGVIFCLCFGDMLLLIDLLFTLRPRQGLKGKLKQRLTTEAGVVLVYSWFAWVNWVWCRNKAYQWYCTSFSFRLKASMDNDILVPKFF